MHVHNPFNTKFAQYRITNTPLVVSFSHEIDIRTYAEFAGNTDQDRVQYFN
jgi:hypothetical protein